MSGLLIDNPIAFENLVASPNVIPGDVIQMRAGTYTGDWNIAVGGTVSQPVTFMPYNGEEVIISGSLTMANSYTNWQNIIIQQPDNTKYAVYMTHLGTRLIDCDISGGYIGVGWFGSGTGALIRCAIHDTTSYGLYTNNNGGGAREITDCPFTNIGGYYAMHLYSEGSNAILDYTVRGCTVSKPCVVSGPMMANINFANNTFHASLRLGISRVTDPDAIRQFVVTGNTFDGLDVGIFAVDCSELEVTDNNFAIQIFNYSQANINMQRGINEISTVIDRNDYVGGYFDLDGAYNVNFANWQAAGFDLNGTYQ